jgi:hypothetical protein
MNLKEYIQSEIKSVLTEDFDLDQAFNDAHPIDEANVSNARLLQSVVNGETSHIGDIKLSKEMAQSFLDWKRVSPHGKKYGNIPFHMLFKAAFNWGLHRFADKQSKEYKELEAKAKKMSFYPSDKTSESVNEEQLDEKLITFSNRAPYGQIVFMAGGAGSGKGFAIDNFIDAAGFKVRDVDEMKKALGKLDELGKVSVDKWFKKYGNKLSTKPPKNNPKGMTEREHIEEFVLGKNLSISDIASDLKNPNNVASLHYIVDTMGLKDKWLINMLKGKSNKETLPNLLFDITAKKVASITEVIEPLLSAGYNPKNIHLIWVLTNYYTAVEANKDRDRVVPDDILLQTHEGAAKTMWEVLTQIKPKGLEGRIDVILNNRDQTAFFVDDKGKKIKVEPSQQNKLKEAEPIVKGFKSLPIKKQGGGIVPENVWKDILKDWILKNVPKTISLTQDVMKTSKDK